MNKPIGCQDHLFSSSIRRCWFFVAMSLTWIYLSACYKYIVEEEKKKNLKFLLETSYVEPSFSFAGFRPRGPSAGELLLRKATYLRTFQWQKHGNPSDGVSSQLAHLQNFSVVFTLSYRQKEPETVIWTASVHVLSWPGRACSDCRHLSRIKQWRTNESLFLLNINSMQ